MVRSRPCARSADRLLCGGHVQRISEVFGAAGSAGCPCSALRPAPLRGSALGRIGDHVNARRLGHESHRRPSPPRVVGGAVVLGLQLPQWAHAQHRGTLHRCRVVRGAELASSRDPCDGTCRAVDRPGRRLPSGARCALAVGRAGWATLVVGLLVARLGFVWEFRSAYLAPPLDILDIRDGGWSPTAGFVGAWAFALSRQAQIPARQKAMRSGLIAGTILWVLGAGVLSMRPDTRQALPALSRPCQ